MTARITPPNDPVRPASPVKASMGKPQAARSQARRVDIASMHEHELTAFRDAVRVAREGKTASEFNRIANDHGQPFYFCPHGRLSFLPWHRRYIRRMEDVIGVPIPYWDWTRDAIPRAFTDDTYVDGSGRLQPNPLRSGIQYSGLPTTRGNRPIPTKSLNEQVRVANKEKGFEQFSKFLEWAHNTVHGRVGGTMVSISNSAFDPIFWCHHVNIDRIWWRWQLANPDSLYRGEAIGSMRDSDGTFRGSDFINSFTDWEPANRQRRSASRHSLAIAIVPKQTMIVWLHGLPTSNDPCLIEVKSLNCVLGSTYTLGMSGSGKPIVRQNGPVVITEAYNQLIDQGHTAEEIESDTIVVAFNELTNQRSIINEIGLRFEKKLI